MLAGFYVYYYMLIISPNVQKNMNDHKSVIASSRSKVLSSTLQAQTLHSTDPPFEMRFPISKLG